MSNAISTKPYMIRALHEWCMDSGMTPHLLVEVDANTRVPAGYVKDGEIVLNLNYAATKDLQMGNDAITFSARFGGVSHHLYVPINAVRGIFARESGQGMFFQPEEAVAENVAAEDEAVQVPSSDEKPAGTKKPSLKLIK